MGALAGGYSMRFLALLGIPLVFACTLLYEPVSDWERRVYEASVFDVFPDDVRKHPDKYGDVQIAWAGLISAVRIDEEVEPPMMHLDVEHKFFSWKVDGTTRQYWLSPRGEGNFSTSWPMKPDWDLDRMRELILEGDMVIVYGVPRAVLADGKIDLGQARYVRHIPKNKFRTDIVEYGRPGEPSRVLKVF
jgi:hypothetical protein